MRKVIKGRVYDTEKAELVYYFENDIANNLFYVREELYRKRNGEYFLYAEGGAGTKYAEYVGNNHWKPGTVILPLSYDDAMLVMKEVEEK